MFPTRVETPRLRLERLGREAVPVAELYPIASADPGIEAATRYLPWDPHETPKETHDFLVGAEEKWEERSVADYAVRPREGEDGAGDLAGLCGLNLEWDRDTAELGIWLRRRFWGRGYSGERALALAHVAFEVLDVSLLAVTTHVENEQSRRAIEKYVERLGGRREGTFRNHIVYDDGTVADEHRWSVSAAEYADADPDLAVAVHDDRDGDAGG